MVVFYTKKFQKSYRKLPRELQEQFKVRRNIFLADSFNSVLGNHALHGEYAGCRSINITGDCRAIFFLEKEDTVRFIAIGTHHELFGT